MVNKTASFKKKGNGKKGNFNKNGKLDPNLKLSASTAKEMVTGSKTAPKHGR